MTIAYHADIVAWANEQAALIRAGQFSQLDLENIAEEIADVGKSEQRELASRMAVLLAHLLKWHYQPEKRTRSWPTTIKEQRKKVAIRLQRTPSLKPMLADPEWIEDMWTDAAEQAGKETGFERDTFPETCPWAMQDVLTEGWLPSDETANGSAP